jgi:hypothetical protein
MPNVDVQQLKRAKKIDKTGRMRSHRKCNNEMHYTIRYKNKKRLNISGPARKKIYSIYIWQSIFVQLPLFTDERRKNECFGDGSHFG